MKQVRLLQGVDLTTLKVRYPDRKGFGKQYQVGKDIPTPVSDDITKRGLVPYAANCHCGAITYTINTSPLYSGENEVRRCNCSICTHNGYLLVYPNRTDVIFHTGFDHLRSYLFGSKSFPHKFCPTCGSSVFIDPVGKIGRDFLTMNVGKLRKHTTLGITSC